MGLQNRINMQISDSFIPKTFILTPSEIAGAFASPVTLISAPGANKIILPYCVHVFSDFNSVAYTGGGTPRLTIGSTVLGFDAATITNASSTYQGIQQVAVVIANVNQPLQFTNLTAPFASGDSDLHIHILYRIWSFN